MQGKSFVFGLVVLMILLVLGGYFVYTSVSKNDSSEVADENRSSNKNERFDEKAQSNSKNTRENSKENQSANESKNESKTSHNFSNGANNKKSSKNEKVVDQTISALNKTVEKVLPTNKSLGAIKEKIKIEILLMDGEQNKILENYTLKNIMAIHLKGINMLIMQVDK
jgi:hypothetical protein